MMTKIILFIVLMLPGKEPSPFQMEMADLVTCMIEVQNILSQPGDELKKALADGGMLQAGCVVVFPPTRPAALGGGI